MTAKVLVDTNILVYAYDRTEPAKQARALDTLDVLATQGQGLLSVQILAEFFWVVTTKLADPVPIRDAERHVQAFLDVWSVADITSLIVLEAIRGVQAHRLAYWDAQIWATALLNQTPIVLSEEFQDGRSVEGIRFLNPLSRQFSITQLDL